MVALRKDVKVGFVVGGIAIAVLVVYLGLSALAGKSAPAAGDRAFVDTTKPRLDDKPVARATDAKPSAPVTAAAGNPISPVAPTPAASGDVWANAFNSGSIQPSVSVTPSLPPRDAPAKPTDVIDALNNPGRAAAPPQTASATDPSGSFANGASRTTLTKFTVGSTTQPAQAAPAAGGATHVVKAGETFSSIAAEHYGSATLFKLIVDANPNVDPGKMKPGATLTLPPHEKSTKLTATSAAAGDAAAKVDPARQYVVKPGDSLEAIATALYGERSKWQSIYDANKPAIGDSPAKLKVGTTLTLPTPPTAKK